MHSWSTFGARMSHRQIRTHKIHHSPHLGEATTFPFIVYYVPLHNAHIQKAFCPKTPMTLGPITLRADLRLKLGLKENYSPHRELFNGMSHATCMQENQVDSQLLVVGSQIANMIFDLYFDHNLCFKCLNGSCEPILDI
jgi:hypothetical protein